MRAQEPFPSSSFPPSCCIWDQVGMSLSLLCFRWSNVFLFKVGQTTPQVFSVLGWLFETKNFVAVAQLLVLVK